MNRLATCCLLTLLLTQGTLAPAHADEPVPDQGCPPPHTLKKCGELGERYYQSGQYSLSIQAFRQAYVLKPLPIFLYDMAQAHRLAGQTDEAIQLYERYLREDPGTQQKAEIDAYLAQLHQKQEQDRLAAAARLRLLEQPPSQPPRPVYKKWWFWTALGTVAAGAIVTGAVLGTRPGETTLQPINAR